MVGAPPGTSVSPVGRWLQGSLLDAEAPGKLLGSYTVREEWTNPIGTLHGGIISLIFDDLMGAALFSMGLATHYVSLNLHVNFLGPAKLGDTVLCTTAAIRTGKTVAYLEAYLRHTDGRIVAHAISNLVSTGAANPFLPAQP